MQDLLLSKQEFSFCCFRPEPQQKAPLVPPPPPPPPPPDPTPPEPEEEILGSDDEEQEDPADYCKGDVLALPTGLSRNLGGNGLEELIRCKLLGLYLISLLLSISS